MKDEFLKYGDYNVVLVDWTDGSTFPYTQATANTRVVGAVIAKLIKTLQVSHSLHYSLPVYIEDLTHEPLPTREW